MNYSDEVIDLTVSFYNDLHQNVVINLIEDDDSFYYLNHISNSGSQKKNSIRTVKKSSANTKDQLKKQELPKHAENKEHKDKSVRWGDCPICWDELDKNSLASTKCGHVYCMKCLERSLKVEKKCPTCRRVLKGSNAYHPLYLN